jgi:hypothetical protein
MVLSNCAIDAVSIYPTYRKPFDLIFQRAKTEEWRAWGDSNARPLVPEASVSGPVFHHPDCTYFSVGDPGDELG